MNSPHPTLGRVLRQRRPHPSLSPTHLVWATDHGRSAVWASRDARKGRYQLRAHHHAFIPASGSQPLLLRVKRSGAYKPHLRADVTFWVAFFFLLGSIVWVANGFAVYLPVVRPSTESETLATAASGLAFVGGSLFEIGAYLGLLEAGNRGREMAFGESIEDLIYGDSSSCSSLSQRTCPADDREKQEERPSPMWLWFPPMRLREIGYLSALVQMFAATIFWVSTLTGLPGVIPGFSEGDGSTAIIDVFFWTPQVIGGTGFVISSLLLMYEVQAKWWKPAPFTLGWQIGVWNLIGAIGFLLCGAFGYSSSSKAIYQSNLSTFWGSFAFLIGSAFQLYEAIWREPPNDDASASTGGDNGGVDR